MGTIYDSDAELIEAAANGDVRQVESLLGRGANPNTKDVIHRGTPLQVAAIRGNLAVIKVLIQHGADVNMKAGEVDETALEGAAIAGRADVVEWLLGAGATVPLGGARQKLIAELSQLGERRLISMITTAKIQRG